MPNRILRDAILTSDRVASLDWAAEVFYRRLHSIVDDYGRHEAGHQLLRARCYPLQTDSVRVADIARWMAACQKSGLILVYGANGKQYLEVCNFGQQLRSASKCPAPDINCEQVLANEHLGVCVSVCVSEGVSEREQGASPAAPPSGKGSRSDSGSRLPADWALPADWREWARAERPDIDPDREAENFADYWHGVAGAKGRKADWFATWRNWIRRANAPRSTARASPDQPMGKQMQGIAALEELKNAARQQMAAGGSGDGVAEAVLSLAGPHAGR